MSFLIRNLARLSTRGEYRRFIADARDPEAAQARLWSTTIRVLAQAPFWKDRFGEVPSRLEDFEITDFGTYQATLQEDLAGSVSRLSGESILFWAESSGTTGSRKLFPITDRYRRQFQSTNAPLIHSLLRRHPGFLRKPVLYFASTLPQERSPAGVEIGFISGYNYRNVPGLLRRSYAFPMEAMRDPDTHAEWAPLYGVVGDLSAMIAITPARVRLFAESLASRIESYWPYLEGRKRMPDGMPPVRVARERLDRLKQAFSKKPFSFREVWPSLEFIGCWKASGCSLQLASLAPYLQGEVKTVDVTYSATEGWVNVPLFDDQSGGPVHPGSVLAEFIEVPGEFSRGRIRKLWELEAGKDYEILLTNVMGLVRYRLKDVVRCTGHFHRSPIIEFVGKAEQELILGMIRISEDQWLKALEQTPDLGKFKFVIGPNASGDQPILYFAQGQEGWDESGAGEWIKAIHGALLKINSYYRRDTAAGLLRPLGMKSLPGTHRFFAASQHAQAKPRLLVSTPH